MADAFAAGDGAGTPVKQGGIACQQADVIAEQIAQYAGAPVEPQPLQPVLRGRLLTGPILRYLSDHNVENAPESQPMLFAAHRKVDGRYLSPWIADMDGVSLEDYDENQMTGEHVAVDISSIESGGA
jgi:sulfide:quinone oxidoreductase